MVKGPRHLWTGDWRSDSRDNADSLESLEPLALSEGAGDDAEPEIRTSRTAPASRNGAVATTTTRRPGRGLFVVGLVALVAGVALAATSLIGNNGSTKKTATPAALPAFSKSPLKPRKGQTRAGAVYDAASPAVVSVRASNDSGTGFLVDNKGTIVTNAHVVNGENRLVVRFGLDGKAIDADVLGVDQSTDLAALSIPAASIPRGTKPLKFADSRNVRVGDTAIAIGNPFDLDRTATEGIVSAIGRTIEAPNNFSIDNVIQTDAPINPGNSGGPLLNEAALVIGVNAQIATGGTSQGNVGIGFAIPSNTVRQVLPLLEKGVAIKRAYMGVATSPPDPGRPTGAQIGQITAGGPADQAGLQVGDVIREVGGQKVPNANELSTIVERYKPGDRVSVVVDRGGSTQTVEVTLGTRPNTAGP